MAFETVRDILEYVELQFEYFKTKTQRDTLHTVTYLAVRLVILLVLTMFFFLTTVASAFLLGEWLGKIYAGFLIIAGLYLSAAVILIVFRKKLSTYLFNKIFEAKLEIFKIEPYTLDVSVPELTADGREKIIRRENESAAEPV